MPEPIDTLKKLGTQIQYFSQSNRTDALQDPVLRPLVKEGMCAGICMDWIRRVLITGKRTYAEGKGTEYVNLRMAKAWHTIANSDKKFGDTISSDLMRPFNAEINRINDSFDQKRVQTQSIGTNNKLKLMGSTSFKQLGPNEKTAKLKRFQEALDKVMNDLSTSEEQKKQKWENLKKLYYDPQQISWQAYSREMDEFIVSLRSKHGKTGTFVNTFSKLDLVKVIDSERIRVDAFMKRFMQDDSFLPLRAAYMGFGKPGIEGGHAIAMHRLNTSEWDLFDPNYGVYRMKAPMNALAAVRYLFEKIYKYQNTGQVTAGYKIFQGPQGWLDGQKTLLKN